MGSGAQSVPGTWGPSRRGINRKRIEEFLSAVSLEWEWKAQEGGDLPHDWTSSYSSPPKCRVSRLSLPFSCPLP